MKTTPIESGATLIELEAGETAIVWDKEGGSQIIMPNREDDEEINPVFAVAVAVMARLTADEEFFQEQLAWFDEHSKH